MQLFREGTSTFRLINVHFKGGTEVIQATPPPAPSTADAINAWVQSMPQVFAQQQIQAPKEAQQQLELAQQFALPLAQAYQGAQNALYPNTSGLQESMAGQAQEGINATSMPEWMRKQYQSDFNANLGTNAGSPIGADYVSRGMQNQLFQQKKYYNDLGLSLAGRQPLSQPAAPNATNYAATFTPQNVMQQMGQNYGVFSSASRPLGYSSGGGGIFGSMFG